MADDRPALYEEIEIMPEMMRAGVDAAYLFEPTQDDFDVMLPAIYRAMRAASRGAASRFQKGN